MSGATPEVARSFFFPRPDRPAAVGSYSALAASALVSFAYFSRSALMRAENSSGELRRGIESRAGEAPRRSFCFRMAATSP